MKHAREKENTPMETTKVRKKEENQQKNKEKEKDRITAINFF